MPASVGSSVNGSERLSWVLRGYEPIMAKYELNERAVAHARDLIATRQYVVKSTWGDVQPSADDENTFLETHPWDEYAAWHLGLTVDATDETKARYAFVCGDFRRVHRSALIAVSTAPRSGITR